MNAESREVYVQLSKKDKQRYDAQLKDLMTKGYFTSEDGYKISSLPLKD